MFHPSRVSSGLCKGSSDLIGIAPGGRFLAAEVKTKGVYLSAEQRRFITVVRELGGVAGEVRDVADVVALLDGGAR